MYCSRCTKAFMGGPWLSYYILTNNLKLTEFPFEPWWCPPCICSNHEIMTSGPEWKEAFEEV